MSPAFKSLLLPFWKDEPAFQEITALPVCQGQAFLTTKSEINTLKKCLESYHLSLSFLSTRLLW